MKSNSVWITPDTTEAGSSVSQRGLEVSYRDTGNTGLGRAWG